MRQTIAAGAVLLLAACAGDATPTAPPVPISFSTNGWVNDTAFRPVAQARIDVVDGPQAGAVTTTDDTGRFSFTQTFTAALTLRASKDGYVPATGGVTPVVGSFSASAQLVMGSPNAPVDLTGNYLLTLTADSACVNLPPVARMRTYPVTVVRSTNVPTTFQGTVVGPTFFTGSSFRYDRFSAGVFGDFVRFSFYSSDEANGLVEQVGPDTCVTIAGEADAIVAGSTVDAQFSGQVGHCSGARSGPVSFSCLVTPVDCSSKNHRLTLTRQ